MQVLGLLSRDFLVGEICMDLMVVVGGANLCCAHHGAWKLISKFWQITSIFMWHHLEF